MVGKIPRTEFYKELDYKSAELPVKIAVFKFGAPLNFANAELFRERLYKRCEIDLPAVLEARDQMKPTTGHDDLYQDPNEQENAPATHLDVSRFLFRFI